MYIVGTAIVCILCSIGRVILWYDQEGLGRVTLEG
jgi:hypothetical protein